MKKIVLIIIIISSFVISARSQNCGLICNGDFELPALGHWAQVFDSTVPCWHTTELDSIMEIWPSGYNGVPAYHGNQFIEMDANYRPTIYQNFLVTTGANITIGFAHRGRAGIDTMTVSIGPAGGPYVTLGTYADGTAAWGYYTINYTIPNGFGNYYSLRFNAISSVAGPTIGNFLDDVSATGGGGLTATLSSTNVSCFSAADGSATVTAVLSGIPPYTYQWSPSGGTNMTATGLSAGVYSCHVTDANGCNSTDSITIAQPTILTASATMTPATCISNDGTATVTAAGGTSPYAYVWNPSGQTTATATNLSAGTYTVTVTDKNGCTAASQVTVTSNSGPSLSVSISGATSICNGMSATLCANINGGVGVTAYLWEPGNLTSACITVSPATSTTYTLLVTDNCGSATATATEQINPLPVINFSADVYQGCTPLCIQFYNNTTISEGGLASYVWAFGNGDTLQSKDAVYCYPSAGIYNVRLTVVSDSGCSSTLEKINMITAFASPNAAFTFSPRTTNILSPTIQFADKSMDRDSIVYRWWNFGDATDSTSSLKNPSHTYQDTGSYCARLVVMDTHGCVDTTTDCLVINPAFSLYIPSAFTPDGDGLNDTFQPKGKYIKSFEMYIFDRWGMQLFHSTNIANGWNGTTAGGSVIAQEDTYVYKITVIDSQDNQHSYIGNITLLK